MLTARQTELFRTIVEEFIATADPVGSKALMAKYNLPYSSATIRNEMMELERLGLLEKTHTSSGRVPSINGYQFYVENLLESNNDYIELEHEISNLFDVNLDLEEAIKRSCDVLSQMTSLTSVVLGPDASNQYLEHLKLFPVNEKSAVAVFITNTGHTENRTFFFDEDISIDDLQRCTEILNDRLQGTLITEVVEKMESLKPILASQVVKYDTLFKAFATAFMKFASEQVYASGQTNMLYQPEFSDLERLRGMMKMLESNKWFNELANSSQASVKMSESTDLMWVEDMAVVSAKFKVSEHEEGEMFVVGPNRMQYNKILAMMKIMRKTLEDLYRKR
ncbi:MAG: heat-inducible transcriptional repressor HrcA [Erysipelotrichaceae bacterium]